MRWILAVLLFSLPALGQSAISIGRATGRATSAAAYFCRNITLDHTKAGSADAVNFPVLISGTYSYLATVANGGQAANANGYDVGFYSDQTRSTRLAWETELYTASTGQVVYDVKIPTLSHTVDTVIAMCFGDSSITTDQSNRTGTWNTNFAAVWHLPNGSTLSVNDATSNAKNGTPHGTTISATTGQTDGGVDLKSTGGDYISFSGVAFTGDFTVSGWANLVAASGGVTTYNTASLVGAAPGASASVNGYSQIWRFYSGSGDVAVAGAAVTTGTWHHVAVTRTGTVARIYLDGVASGTTGTYTGTLTLTTIGQTLIGGVEAKFDEVRLQSVAASASWLQAEYNCGGNTCYSVGAQTAH